MAKLALVFLQNAWSPLYAGDVWPRPSWLRALHQSRSGLRLAVMTNAAGDQVVFHYDNTTPQVGEEPRSILPPDPAHITTVLAQVQPDYLVCCGRQAQGAVQGEQPTLWVPHPASRVVTNKLYRQAGRLLAAGFTGLVQLRQARGAVEVLHGPAQAATEQ